MECHPIIYNHMRRGIKNGARMVVIDPRKIDQVKKADKWLGLNVGTDICLANAMGQVIIEEGLYDKEFVERATKGFEAYREKVAGYTPEYAEQVTGIPAEDIREVARMYATAEKATLNWTLGITEHHNGADAVANGEIRCMYVIGENPVQSDADEHKHEKLFESLDFLVVQDILKTKTARMADVVLPAAASWAETDGTVINSERRVKQGGRGGGPPEEKRGGGMSLRD